MTTNKELEELYAKLNINTDKITEITPDLITPEKRIRLSLQKTEGNGDMLSSRLKPTQGCTTTLCGIVVHGISHEGFVKERKLRNSDFNSSFYTAS